MRRSCKLFLIQLLLQTIGWAKQKETKQIAYLSSEKFRLQNDFIYNMLSHLPDVEFELFKCQKQEEIAKCLNNGTCSASLDYGVSLPEKQFSSAYNISLPILDDPALSVTMPKYDQAITQTIVVVAYWIAIFAFFVISALYVAKAEKFAKPVRADVRTTPLSVIDKDSIEIFTKPEEDIVYAAIRKSN